MDTATGVLPVDLTSAAQRSALIAFCEAAEEGECDQTPQRPDDRIALLASQLRDGTSTLDVPIELAQEITVALAGFVHAEMRSVMESADQPRGERIAYSRQLVETLDAIAVGLERYVARRAL